MLQDATSKVLHNQERIQIIEAVIGTLGLVDVFDSASLKALRATCRAFRDLVDGTGALSTVKFAPKEPYDLKGLRAWAASARWMALTRSLIITGKMPRKVPVPLLDSIATQRPPISKLELNGVGEAGEVLLSAPLEQLRELTVVCSTRKRAVFGDLLRNQSLSGLRSLHLENIKVDAAMLATTLARFTELQSLVLHDFDIKGRVSEPLILQENSLSRLEALSIADSLNVDRVGLFSAQGPALPALRLLNLVDMGFRDVTLHLSPWLSQLTALELNARFIAGPGVAAALNGAPLQELTLHLGPNRTPRDRWEWKKLELPHITRLEVFEFSLIVDVLADAALAKMPALRTAALPITSQTSAAGLRAFNTAFPNLESTKTAGEM